MLIVLIPGQGKMRTPFSHLSWPVPLLSLQRTVLQDLHFNLQAQSQGSHELLVGKQLSLIQSVPLMFPIHLWFLKKLNALNKPLAEPKVFPSVPFLFFHTLFDCTHQPPLPPSSASLVICAPWFESWRWGVRGGNNSTWKWAGDCLPPSVVMEGLSDRAPQAPPWWLISCGALELWSDILAHQTPLSLSGTPLIAQCFIIVPHSALVSGALPSHLHVRECAT